VGASLISGLTPTSRPGVGAGVADWPWPPPPPGRGAGLGGMEKNTGTAGVGASVSVAPPPLVGGLSSLGKTWTDAVGAGVSSAGLVMTTGVPPSVGDGVGAWKDA
jgi:hypothetical protein